MMMWNYSTTFISHEDYKRSSYPKKCLAGFFAGYGSALLLLRYQYNINAEVFYKRLFLTPLTPILAILPFMAIY